MGPVHNLAFAIVEDGGHDTLGAVWLCDSSGPSQAVLQQVFLEERIHIQ